MKNCIRRMQFYHDGESKAVGRKGMEERLKGTGRKDEERRWERASERASEREKKGEKEAEKGIESSHGSYNSRPRKTRDRSEMLS